MPKKTYTYQNTSKEPQLIVGLGMVDPGNLVDHTEEIKSKNFKLLTDKEKSELEKKVVD